MPARIRPRSKVVRRDFALSTRCPARLEAEISINGTRAAANVRVELIERASDYYAPSANGRGLIVLRQPTDAEASVSLGPLAPGEHILLVTVPGPWRTAHSVTVPAGRLTRVPLDIRLVEARLTCRDAASGGVLSDTDIVFERWSELGVDTSTFTTDTWGQLSLELPPGSYSVLVAGTSSEALDLEWTQSGPSPTEIHFGK